MALQERDFYHEKPETKPATYACPHCKRRNEYQVRWITRTKKDGLPAGADERDRAQFPKLRNYMVRTDDVVVFATCRDDSRCPSPVAGIPGGRPCSSRLRSDDDNFGNR